MKGLNILAVGAHPDDIEVLCAGTLAKYHKLENKINIAIATSGGAGHPTIEPKKITAIRKKEAIESANILDANLYWLDIEDQFLIDDRETRIIFINTIRECKPDIIFTCAPNDYHCDHRMVSELVFKTIIAAALPGVKTKQKPINNIPALYYFDIVNGLNFLPDYFVDITDFIDIKRQMLLKHDSQMAAMRELIKTDLISTMEINALYRGRQSNVKYAEAFKKADSYLMISTQRLLP